MNNVLVIGAGKRARGALLPALRCMPETFRIAAVCTRHTAELSFGRDTITTVDSLDRVDLEQIDLIAVAATIAQVPSIVENLARRKLGRAVLLLDTPVLPLRKLAAMRWFTSFKRVLVSEDNIALPPFLLARRLIDTGRVGRLRRIFFFHNGFKFHALAGLKLLTGRSRLLRIVGRKYKDVRQKTIDFEDGVVATMYEPRDYATGKFLLECEGGSIADYDHAISPVHRIGYQIEGRVYRGLTLDGTPVPRSPLDEAYVEHTSNIEIFDASPMNTMKVRGMMDVLQGSLEDRSPFHYDAAEGVADSFAAWLADRVGYVPAPHVVERSLRRLQGRRA